MRTLDEKTLERLAEVICGGEHYARGLVGYRSGPDLARFMSSATGMAYRFEATRKWWLRDQLRALNNEDYGGESDAIPWMLGQVIVRIVDTREYGPGEHGRRTQVATYVNMILRSDGVELQWNDDEALYEVREIPDAELKASRRPGQGATAEGSEAVAKGALLDAVVRHTTISSSARSLFVDGHHAQAVLEAYKAVNNYVKQKSGRVDLDGRDLMAKVFRKEAPLLKVTHLSGRSGEDEQEGFMFLFMGSMVGIRNPKAHEPMRQPDAIRTLQYLALASLLCEVVDEAT